MADKPPPEKGVLLTTGLSLNCTSIDGSSHLALLWCDVFADDVSVSVSAMKNLSLDSDIPVSAWLSSGVLYETSSFTDEFSTLCAGRQKPSGSN